MATQNECRACFARFDSPAELGSHVELFRQKLFTLTTRIQAIYLSLPLGDDEILPKEDGNPCPICGEHFELQKELDKHIWAHQSELSKLSDGIKAAVWHLPALDQGPDDYGVHDKRGEGAFRCSYPQCNAGMDTQPLLTRHYGKHIPCHEICVVCHKQFTRASTYIAHVKTHSSRDANSNDTRISFAKHRSTLLTEHVESEQMTLDLRNRNRQEATGQEENVRNVEELSPNKKRRQQEPGGQTKRRRGNPQDDAVPSSQATLPGNLAPNLNHDPDLEPNPGPCPDPILTMHSAGGNWDHGSGQIFPTPPSSSLGVDMAPDPHLSDAYPPAAFTLEPLQDSGRDQRAPIFHCPETIPFPPCLGSQESCTFSVYRPTMPVDAGSSACGWTSYQN